MPTDTLIQHAEEISLNDQNEVDQILGNPPGWLLHYGISIVMLATALFLALAWLIKYPDVLEAKVQLLTQNPAIRVMPLASGKLAELLVSPQQSVAKNDLLAVIENPISRQDIALLESLLAQVENTTDETAHLKSQLPQFPRLGNLQNSYAALVQKVEDYQYYLQQSSPESKIATLQNQIQHTRSLNKSLEKQQVTLNKEVALSQKNYQRNQQLSKEGVISDLDLEQIETAYLQYQRQSDNFSTQIIQNNIQIEQIQSQITELKEGRTDGKTARERAIKEILQNLKSQIAVWKQTYLITAPIAGKVHLEKIWSTQQFVMTGEELLTIVPEQGAGKIIAKAALPIANAGKVKTGQRVNIRLDGFPYQEYGVIRSEVLQMALVPQKEFYTIELAIPDSLLTTYHKMIPFTQEMQGMAKIITEDRRILQRIFDRVWSMLKNT